jgi:hypothetical protein
MSTKQNVMSWIISRRFGITGAGLIVFVEPRLDYHLV